MPWLLSSCCSLAAISGRGSGRPGSFGLHAGFDGVMPLELQLQAVHACQRVRPVLIMSILHRSCMQICRMPAMSSSEHGLRRPTNMC